MKLKCLLFGHEPKPVHVSEPMGKIQIHRCDRCEKRLESYPTTFIDKDAEASQ